MLNTHFFLSLYSGFYRELWEQISRRAIYFLIECSQSQVTMCWCKYS